VAVEPLAFLGFLPHIGCKGLVANMRSLRSFFITLAGLTFVAVIALFTASIGIALAGVATVLLFGQWLSSLLSSQEREPVKAYARTRRPEEPTQQRGIRVWNDGKGTIIDM
jgi:hypothetical protein